MTSVIICIKVLLQGYNLLNTDKVNNFNDSFVFINLISKDAAPILLQDH